MGIILSVCIGVAISSMRKTNYPLVVAYIVFILAVLLLAWWIAGDYYKPYPPATPTATQGYWPTRITATIVPSATPTKVIHTPIQPTIGYTETPVVPPVTVTPEPSATFTPVLISTATQAPLVYGVQKTIECEMMIFRGRLVIYYPYCRIIERRTLATRLPSEDDVIWWPPITKPPYPVATFTGSPIFIP